MTVANQQTVSYRHWSGYSDPQLPSGFWVGNVQTTGDASAGEALLELLFGQARGIGISVEQYNSILRATTVGENAIIETSGIDELNTRFVAGIIIPRGNVNYILNTNPAANDDAVATTLHSPPFFAGVLDGGSPLLRIRTNNQNGIVMQFFAQGYWWSTEAMTKGPRVPVDGLYHRSR